MRGIIVAFAVVALTVILCGIPHESFAQSQGQSCSAGAVAPIVNGANSDGNSLVCISGTWQYPTYTVQSYSGALGASCTGYPAGALHYSTSANEIEFCNGTNWSYLATGSTSCGSPSGLSFTNITSASLSTVYTSGAATITFSGCSSSLSVSVSGSGSPQISVNGGAWSSSGAILSGQTLQVRLTSSGSVSTGLTATVTVGSSSTNWTVTTRSATLQIFMTSGLYIGGNIGGLTGADTICQTEAAAASLSGTYKAILSTDTVSASSRFTLSYPIVNAYNGSTVSSTNLWSGTISNGIVTPTGAVGGCCGSTVFTGTTASGASYSDSYDGTCDSWTNNSSSVRGMVGYNESGTGGGWLYRPDLYSASDSCNNGLAIYCLQQ